MSCGTATDQPTNHTKSQTMMESDTSKNTLAVMNLTLLDPSQWGWTAMGDVADVLGPHSRARRKTTRLAFRQQEQRQQQQQQQKQDQEQQQKLDQIQKQQQQQQEQDAVPNPAKKQKLDTTEVNVLPQAENMVVQGPLAPSDPGKLPSTLPGNPIPIDVEQEKHESSAQVPEHVNAEQAQNVEPHQAKDDQPVEITQKDPPMPGESSHNVLRIAGFELVRAPSGTVKNTPAPNDDEEDDGDEENREEEQRPLSASDINVKVSATLDNKLDIYTYHRGREGMEPRDPNSGDLLCDVEPSDTNFNDEEPRWKLNILVEFPLCDDDEAKYDIADEREADNVARYKELVPWNLSSPSTQTPLVFAQNVASEFGLNFGQTADLALSIEQQLEAHIFQNISQSSPYPLHDPSGNRRRIAAASQFKRLYGDVLGASEGGKLLTKKAIQEKQQTIRHFSRQSSTISSSRTVTNSAVADSSIEAKYVIETRRKAQMASIQEVAEKTGLGVRGLLTTTSNCNCHACHKHVSKCYIFACGIESHTFCEAHLKEIKGLSIGNKGAKSLPFCPICSLSCRCTKCSRRLEAVAADLKKLCREQNAAPEDVRMENVLEKCRRKKMASADSEKSSKNKRSHPKIERFKHLVRKPPATDFPREVYGMRESEAGAAIDYATVYANGGSFLCEIHDSDKVSGEPPGELPAGAQGQPVVPEVVVEDGNVDSCHSCKQHGNLLCCDFCPRAFHPRCIDTTTQVGDSAWECPMCQKENGVMDGDIVTGTKSASTLSAMLTRCDVTTESPTPLRVLSMITAMITRLMGYEFGYMFRDPVNVEQVPEYKRIVKNPMDLGTIKKKLCRGGYFEGVASGIKTFDDALTSILTDVELVWHNCFSFNYEGSAIYRMAKVHRKRMLKTQEQSFGKYLSDPVKKAVHDFVEACAAERKQIALLTPSLAQVQTQAQQQIVLENKLSMFKPKGKHKITVKTHKGGHSRRVAVFDPTTCMVVKVYSTIKSAGQAATFLNGLGHRCEWSSLSEFAFKTIFGCSGDDPSVLLFGYRWIPLDELQSGRALIPPVTSGLVEVRDRTETAYFFSGDDAALYLTLPPGANRSTLRRAINDLELGDEWTSIEGLSFRRPKDALVRQDKMQQEKQGDGTVREKQFAKTPQEAINAQQHYLLKHSTVIRQDGVTGQILIGFQTIRAAHEDWRTCCDTSPTVALKENELSLEAFIKEFVQGERTIDGLGWSMTSNALPAGLSGGSANKSCTGSDGGVSGMNVIKSDVTGGTSEKAGDGIKALPKDAPHPVKVNELATRDYGLLVHKLQSTNNGKPEQLENANIKTEKDASSKPPAKSNVVGGSTSAQEAGGNDDYSSEKTKQIIQEIQEAFL